MYYYTDVTNLTAADYEVAGSKADAEHNDEWFACYLFGEGE